MWTRRGYPTRWPWALPEWSHDRQRGYPTRWPWALPEWSHVTEGEWVSMRPTGALPLQQGWRGLQSAWETANTTLPTYVVPFTLGTEFPRVHFRGFGSNSSFGGRGRPKRCESESESERPQGEFRNQGRKHKVSMT